MGPWEVKVEIASRCSTDRALGGERETADFNILPLAFNKRAGAMVKNPDELVYVR